MGRTLGGHWGCTLAPTGHRCVWDTAHPTVLPVLCLVQIGEQPADATSLPSGVLLRGYPWETHVLAEATWQRRDREGTEWHGLRTAQSSWGSMGACRQRGCRGCPAGPRCWLIDRPAGSCTLFNDLRPGPHGSPSPSAVPAAFCFPDRGDLATPGGLSVPETRTATLRSNSQFSWKQWKTVHISSPGAAST